MGTMVNLDHVLSGMHAVSNDNWEVKRIGGIQLKYSDTEAAKKVHNAGDWSQAFHIYLKAVSFIFPHRKEELEDYAAQVATLFAVVNKVNHTIIINYNKAVHTCVGNMRNLLLTDTSKFKDLRLYWLHPLGQAFRDPIITAQNHCSNLMMTASGSTMRNAPIRHPTVNISTTVPDVGGNTSEGTVIGEEHWAKQPCYACGLLWDTNDISGADNFSDMAHWSLTASPVPGITPREFKNLKALRSIQANPCLFQVNCTLNIARFWELLVDHPNQALVESICHSLHEGYWPHVDTKFDDVDARYPTTLDMSSKGLTSTKHLDFICAQIEVEVTAGRYSAPFGSDLLLGMYSSPVHAVPKPPDSLRLINHQSYSNNSLNSMILKESVSRTWMDGIKSLCTVLLHFNQEFSNDVELLIYKYDIIPAYHNFWVHPLWQIKQIVLVGSKRYVDWCNCFGGYTSYLIFLLFSSVLAWIVQEVKLIRNLHTYIDDNESFAHVGDVSYYPPYRTYYPTAQTKLLKLYIPHTKKKQVYGPVIPYVGFDVDLNVMTILLSDDP